MKLLELYEDLFQYICRLNRMTRAQTQPDYARVRGEIRELLDQITRAAAADVRLLNQVKRLELPVIFFIDYCLATSRLKFAAQWAENRLAKDHNELAGDQRFFEDFLEPDLLDTSEEAEERLAIYYVCLGLGFMGMYQNQPEQIRKYMEQIFQRPGVRRGIESDSKRKISEEAYQHTDTRVLTEPASKKVVLVAYAFAFLTIVVLVIFWGQYYRAIADLNDAMETIQKEAAK